MSVYDSLQLPECDMRARALIAATYLQARGFTQDQLRSIHHHEKRETFALLFDYLSRDWVDAPKKNNAQYWTRLVFIAERHAANAGTFDELVADALARWPL